MIVILFGAPGAGKGTQAELLATREGYRKLSTGDALRRQVRLGTPIGKQAAAIMERGELVPDDVLFGIIQSELSAAGPKDVILLDGYPRNLSQANTLATLESTHPVKAVVHLAVKREELIGRLSGRRVCGSCGATYHISENPPKKEGVCDKCGNSVSQRVDDKAETVAARLDVYEKNTRPVLGFYEKRGLGREVMGQGDPESIYRELVQVIKSL